MWSSSFIHMINVGKDRRVRLAASNSDESCIGEATHGLGKTPELNLRQDSYLSAGFEQARVALGDASKVNILPICGTDGRCGEISPAHLARQIHRMFCRFKALVALRVVVD